MKFSKPSWELTINQLQKLKYPYSFFNNIRFDLSDINQIIVTIFALEPISPSAILLNP